MKSVYVVSSTCYSFRPIAVFQNKKDAESLAARFCEDTNPEEQMSNHIVEVPYIGDPTTYDINDIIQVSITTSQKSFESMIRSLANQFNSEQTEGIDEQIISTSVGGHENE